MSNIKLNIPTKIYFGERIVNDALIAENEIIGTKTLLVTTGGSLSKLGHIENLTNILTGMGIDVCIYERISNNPDISEVAESVILGKEKDVDSVIGLGGGSAMDAAKATAVGIASDIPIENYLFEGIEPGIETLPIIAVPTTSGTGSELSKGAIISSREKGLKTGIRGMAILPKLAIVDPTYTWSVPLRVTMETGFDVLAHAIESYCSENANMFSEMLSEKAITYAGESLRKLKKNLDDHEARKRISYASMIMGLNLLNIGNCLPHRMQYPVGAVTDTSHAAGLVALYPSWIKHEYGVNGDKINDILSLLKLARAEDGNDAKSIFTGFLDELGISRSLTDLGITEEEVCSLSEKVTGNIKNDKLSDIPEIIETIYKESM